MGQTVDVVEVAVALVLVLLVQLVLIERLVIETRSLGRRRRDTVGVLLRRAGSLLSSGVGLVGFTPGARVVVDVGLVGASRVQVGLGDTGGVGAGATKSAGQDVARGLDGEGLAHDGAAAGNDLQVAHGTATRGSLLDAGAGGHGPEGGGRGLGEEWTHCPRLPEECLHDGGEVRLGLLVRCVERLLVFGTRVKGGGW